MQLRSALQLIMGSRVRLLGRQIERRAFRHLAGRCFATAASICLGIPVCDTQCGAKLLRVTAYTRQLFSRPFKSRWVFDVEILARMLDSETSVLPPRISIIAPNQETIMMEYPLQSWRDMPGSELRFADFLHAFTDLLRIAWTYRRNARTEALPSAKTKIKTSNREAKPPRSKFQIGCGTGESWIHVGGVVGMHRCHCNHNRVVAPCGAVSSGISKTNAVYESFETAWAGVAQLP